MRLIAAAVLASLFLAAPGIARAQEVHPACAVTEADFLDRAVKVNGATILVASEKARETILTEINTHRKKAGLWLLEADRISIGLIKNNGALYVGIAMFKDGCVVPGSVHIVAASDWVAFATGIGLSMDDFAKQSDA